ncbi:MAG: response regulator transcription factor [Chloroflexi bacterium]|nr:response regulator transcription factor [Chloroflexota bacterium]
MGKIFIVEDHAVIRRGYISLIKRKLDLEVCGEAASGEDALITIPICAPDLVLIDVSLPGMSGVDLVRHLKVTQPDLLMLVISGHEEALLVEGVLAAGARGYIMKEQAPEVLIDAIYAVLSGKQYLSERMHKKLQQKENLP